MGLVKGGDIQKHRATEPVHDRDISNAFFALRSAVGNKVDSHIAQYQNRMMPIGRLAEYWGYRFTPEYEAGPTADGVIDQKIRETIMAAKNQPSMEGKAQIIQGLADWVSR